MIRLIALAATIAAVVLIVSPRARAALQRNLVAIIIYTATALAVLLVVTGRIHWLIAGGWSVIAALHRALPWLIRLPWLRFLGRLGTRNNRTQDQESGNKDPSGHMSDSEARETLGVGPQAGPEEIAAAHRRLMQRLHPDRGGSPALAQRLNEARARLLGERDGKADS